MSTLAYAALTQKREEAPPGTSTSAAAPGVRVWVDALASLVPAEVLATHGFLIGVMTKTENTTGVPVTTITNPAALKGVFYALVVLSVLLYVGARVIAHSLDRIDVLRMMIPALAFVAWTMLQRTTAFDAAFPAIAAEARTAIAVIGAVVLGLVASMLAYKADQKPVGGSS